MKLKLDLHVHSEISHDGCMTLEEITAAAARRGIDGVAVCDHDAVFSGPAVLNGVLLIPGAEFTTEYGHLLGLFLTKNIRHSSFIKTVSEIREQGGLAVMAHPFQRTVSDEKLMEILPYLDGVEIHNGRADRKNPEANRMAEEFAKKHSLLISAGSDAHLPAEIGNGILEIEAADRDIESVCAAFLRGDGMASGVRGRSMDVARSQLTKLKKKHAKPTYYVKWAAFALKCALEDIRRGADR